MGRRLSFLHQVNQPTNPSLRRTELIASRITELDDSTMTKWHTGSIAEVVVTQAIHLPSRD